METWVQNQTYHQHKSPRRGDNLKAPGREGRAVCLEHRSEGGGSWKSPGLVTWDLVVSSKAVRLQEGILSGGRHDVTHTLVNTLAVSAERRGGWCTRWKWELEDQPEGHSPER